MCDSYSDCNSCCGPGPPPLMLALPPPPPYFTLQEGIASNGNYVDPVDVDMWGAVLILDAKYDDGPVTSSIQSPTLIIGCSLLLLLLVFVATIFFIWKRRGRVKTLVPYRRPSCNTLWSTGVPTEGLPPFQNSIRNLVYRKSVAKEYHNIRTLPERTFRVHYPSGYPIARTPPLFDCMSPGPSPYRSNDRLNEVGSFTYDAESSVLDDVSTQDELNLLGNRAFNESPIPSISGSSFFRQSSRSRMNATEEEELSQMPILLQNRSKRRRSVLYNPRLRQPCSSLERIQRLDRRYSYNFSRNNNLYFRCDSTQSILNT